MDNLQKYKSTDKMIDLISDDYSLSVSYTHLTMPTTPYV